MGEIFPEWLKQRLPSPSEVARVGRMLEDLRLNTVCQSAACPNLGECFSAQTATLMILGHICTRHCSFCATDKGVPGEPDPAEPGAVAVAARRLKLKYMVITSPTRDDLPDGGAQHYANVIRAVTSENPGIKVEVLIPDFQGSEKALRTVLEASPTVIGHNIETVPRLYHTVRPGAIYSRSLEVLAKTKRLRPGTLTKSGIMLGLGEERQAVIEVMKDLLTAGCDIMTLGQYLRPSMNNIPVCRYIPPDEFEDYKRIAEKLGFKTVVSGPKVRSSYRAASACLQVAA